MIQKYKMKKSKIKVGDIFVIKQAASSKGAVALRMVTKLDFKSCIVYYKVMIKEFDINHKTEFNNIELYKKENHPEYYL